MLVNLSDNPKFAVLPALLLLVMLFSGAVFGFDVHDIPEHLEILYIQRHQELQVMPSLDTHFFRQGEQVSDFGMPLFYDRHGHQWDVFWDTRSNRPELISGQGIPFIPGPGNDLVDRCLYGQPADMLNKYIISDSALRFMQDNPDLLRVDPSVLELYPDATRPIGKNNRLWFINFKQVHENIPVKGAGVFFRVNSGNITQFGAHKIIDIPSDFSVKPAVSADKALDIAINHALTAIDGKLDIVVPPELLILPTFGEGRDGVVGEPYQGEPGKGYGARLVYELTFRLNPHMETWFAVVDAQTGDLLQFEDSNKYAGAVYGSVFLEDNLTPEAPAPFPYAQTTQGVTTSGGRLDYPGGSVTTSMDGQFVQISDNCGTINLTSPDGDLNFGSSPNTNCSTPGYGGNGNTRASRTAFYHTNDIIMKAKAYMPDNTWLQNNLLTNVNINSTCNAFWDGTSINFYREGSGCSNTGELSPVIYHEWGHGLDHNTSFTTPDSSSSEALADAASFLHNRVPCIGHNFFIGGGGDCTGVRDVSTRPHARPDNIEDPPYSCNCQSWYSGVLGYQGHCESHIASGAVWDMALLLADAHGGDAGWTHANRLFFETMDEFQAAYRLVSGGQCNPNAVVDGCGSRNWYTVFLFADDDNGNLADGTPNGCLIWEAFNDHGIACGSQPDCYTVCPPISAPEPLVIPGDESVTLTWNPVSNASYYIIFRNSSGCQYERSIIGTTSSTSYTDNTVANDFTYYYSVQAVGSNDACRSQMSACFDIVPGSMSSYGIITLDRSLYSDNDEINITVIDADLYNTGTVDITVESDSNPSGLTVTLTEVDSPSGIFEGSVMTTTTGIPGRIDIAHDDEIRAIYFDEDIGDGTSEEKIATAYADLIPPVITNVEFANISSESFSVLWNTDKSADSVVYWGESTPPTNSIVETDLVTSHQINLTNLDHDNEYFIMIQSTDIAGNTAEDDNNGMYYSIRTLLVLWDQPVTLDNPSRRANQVFPDESAHSAYLADDFVNTETWLIEEIFVPGEMYNGGTTLENAVSLHWRIYADDAGLPAGYPGGGATPFWSLELAPTDPQVSLLLGLQNDPSDTNLVLETPVELPPGTWWFMFYPTMSFSPHGQYGRLSSDTQYLEVAKWINPGNGFGHGTDWLNWNHVSEVTHHDVAFRLIGEITSIIPDDPQNCNATNSNICFGDSTALSAESDDTIYWFENSCGDDIGDAFDTGSTITVSPSVTTTYFARAHNGTNWSDGCCQVTVTVHSNPIAEASNDGPVCPGETVQLTGEPDDMASYEWTGPDFSSGEQNPTLVPPETPGSYEYTLTVTDENGCTDTDTTTVIVNTPPNADASSNSPIEIGETIYLYGLPDGMETYEWSGPDSFTSNEQNPVISNAQEAHAGTYTLTVIDANNCADSANVTVNVTGDPPPIPATGPMGILLLMLGTGILIKIGNLRK